MGSENYDCRICIESVPNQEIFQKNRKTANTYEEMNLTAQILDI